MKKIFYIQKERIDTCMEGKVRDFAGMTILFNTRPLALKHLLKKVEIEDNWIYEIREAYVKDS